MSWTSLAQYATVIGLRANATAIADCRLMVVVARAASVSVVKTSCFVSGRPIPS